MNHLQTIQEVFSDKLLHVPDYQRGYAWDRQQWTDLLDDLDLLEEGFEHYTGTLVLHRNDQVKFISEESISLKTYDVVDGQQRLTTVSLLLHAVALEMKTLPGKTAMAEGILKTYIQVRDQNGFARPKLTLNRDTHDYYVQSILADVPSVEGPRIYSQRRLEEAHRFFLEYLQKQRAERADGYAEWLFGLLQKITDGLKLTVYEVSREAEVGVIFEVMNNRGKQLSEMEKVKNYLLYLASKTNLPGGSQLGESINKAWTTIFESLMASDLRGWAEDQLLRSHWLMAYDPSPRHWNGSNSVKSRFNLRQYRDKNVELVQKVSEYVRSLENACVAYCDILSPQRNNAYSQIQDTKLRAEIREQTEKLVRIDATASFLPLLMSVRLRFPTRPDLYLKYLHIAEKYAFRVYRLAEKRSNTGQSTLFHWGYELYIGQPNPENGPNHIAGLLHYYAPESEFLSRFELGRMNWYNWYGLKYFLYEFEEHLASEHGLPIQMPWSYLVKKDRTETVEHILPQTPDKPFWKERWTEEAIHVRLHDIGNLVLTFDNSSYSNKPFPDKKGAAGQARCYAGSVLFMERQLAKCTDWTPVEADKRREEIIAWAKKRWSVEDDGQVPVVPDEDEGFSDQVAATEDLE